MQVCSGCGMQNPDRAKFCLECGSALAAAPPGGQARKTVTVLFCDVTGSTALGERLDAEAMRTVMSRYFVEMSRVVEAHGGTVEKFIGDAVMAVFGVPALHEDDAVRALRAAAGMRAALTALNDTLDRDHGVRLAVRIGVNTGEVVVGTGGKGTVVTGDAVNVAARLQSAAEPGEILFGAATWSLVRGSTRAEPVAPLQVKGKADAVHARRLIDVDAEDVGASRPVREGSPLVGRDGELTLLAQTFERCTAGGRSHLVTVLGAAGVGKSRLMVEALDSFGDRAAVLTGRCLSYGDDIAFWPLRQILRELVGFGPGDSEGAGRDRLRAVLACDTETDRVVDRLAPLAGLGGTPAEADETHWALRRLVEALGAERPVVLVLDDVHWAQPALLDVVEHLADWTRDTALMLVCLARPEFLDDRPRWGGGKVNATTVLLEPLPADATAELIDNLLAGAPLEAEVRARILDAGGGTPLFVEQMLAMLMDDGVLVPGRAASEHAGGQSEIEVPASISALLAARIDRLPVDERSVLEAGSVIGVSFYLDAVAELSDVPVGPALDALQRKELVRPDRSDLPGQQGYRFLHVLVRDATYAAVPKSRRAGLHERFATWLDERNEVAGAESDEFVGHHLEQAVRLRGELGPLDRSTRELARRGATCFAAAGRRLVLADPASAASLHERAVALLDPADVERVDQLRAAAAARYDAGQLAVSVDLYRSAGDLARDLGDDRQAVLAGLDLLVVSSLLSAGDIRPADVVEARRLTEGFRAEGDTEGVLRAGLVVLHHLNALATWEPVAAQARELLDAAVDLGDARVATAMERYVGAALLFGPAPIEESVEWTGRPRPLTGRTNEIGRTYAHAAGLVYLDRVEEAREALAEADALAADIDNPLARGFAAFGGGIARALLGDWDEADRILRRAAEALRAVGEQGWLSSVLPMLGEVRVVLGDLTEARVLAGEARAASPANDALSQAAWRELLARIEVLEGHPDVALQLADEAVQQMVPTDDLAGRADAAVVRAEALIASGRAADAERALREALTLYERKGVRPRARQVRVRLTELTTASGRD